jgi:Ca2+-binding RTX toxin-like protein
MGTYRGTTGGDVITPSLVSTGVTVTGAPRPSSADDTLSGGSGADTLDGGSGADLLEGGQFGDLVLGGAGADTIIWGPGDGNDTIDGGSGVDVLDFRTANVGETITIVGDGPGFSELAGGRHAFVFRSIAAVQLDVAGVERMTFSASIGADRFEIGDLTGTNVKAIDIDLGPAAATMNQPDNVVVLATGGDDRVSLTTTPLGTVTVGGLAATVTLANAETADRVSLATGAGNDTLDATAMSEGIVANFDGGAGADTLLIRGEDRGGDTNDLIQLVTSHMEGDTLQFVLNGDVSQVNLTDVESVAVQAGTGDDTVVIQGTPLPALYAIDGGAGADTLRGGAGADTLEGGSGDDFVDGNLGQDVLRGGAGDDTIQWDPGDSSDTIDGGSGSDTLNFFMSNASEDILLALNGDHLRLTRNLGSVALDVDNVERIVLGGINNGGGVDHFTINPLAGSDVKRIDIDLGFQPDNAADTIELGGTTEADKIVFSGNADGLTITGLPTIIGVTHADATDRVTIQGGGGVDRFDISGLVGPIIAVLNGDEGADTVELNGTAAGDTIELYGNAQPGSGDGSPLDLVVNGAVGHARLMSIATMTVDAGAGDDLIAAVNSLLLADTGLLLDGGTGNDTIRGGRSGETLSGGAGNDVLDGNVGNDVIRGGGGDDTVSWDAGDGSDIIDGGSGFDVFTFNTTNSSELIVLQQVAGETFLTRDIASISHQITGVERVAVSGFGGGGQDVFFIGDLIGSGIREVDIDLGFTPDNAVDSISMTGRPGGDNVSVASAGGVVGVRGMGVDLDVTHAEAGDRLVLSTLDGNDNLDLTGFAGGMKLILNGGAGGDRFTFGKSVGADVRITDFQAHGSAPRTDVIVLNGHSDGSFAAAVAAGHIVQDGDDVRIGDASGTIVVLQATHLYSLNASDFLFG